MIFPAFPKVWLVAAGAAGLLTLGTGTYVAGRRAGVTLAAAECAAAQHAAREVAQKAAAKAQRTIDEKVQDYEQTRAKTAERASARQSAIVKVVQVPVYRRDCYDDAGGRLLDAAITDANNGSAASGSGTADPVPAAPPTDGSDGG